MKLTLEWCRFNSLGRKY